MAEQTIADRNLHAQSGLLTALKSVRTGKGMGVEEAAAIMGVETDVFEAIEDGRMELNLTELRHYAYSVGAVVDFDVVPANRG